MGSLRRTPPAAAAVAVSVMIMLTTSACGDGDARNAEVPTVERVEAIDGLGEPLADGLPPDIAGFSEWLKLNSRPIPPKSADPHLGNKTVYFNGTARDAAAAATGDATYPDCRKLRERASSATIGGSCSTRAQARARALT